MATKPRKWPNLAAWAREDSIALARQGRRVLVDVLDRIDDPIALRNIAKAIDNYREIESKLVSVGIQSEPENNGG